MSNLSKIRESAYSGNLGHYKNGQKFEVMEYIKDLYWLEKVLRFQELAMNSEKDSYEQIKCSHVSAERKELARVAYESAVESYNQKRIEIIQMKQDIAELIKQVKDIRYQTVLRLRIVDRKSNSSVAVALHYSTSAICSMYRNALEQLEEEYLKSLNSRKC